MRTFCEHLHGDGVQQGDIGCVCARLEPEPLLDSSYGPNALVMRRSGVRISETAPLRSQITAEVIEYLVFSQESAAGGAFVEKRL